MRPGLALGLLLASLSGTAQADAPPESKPAIWTRCSLDGRACATVDQKRSRTTVRRRTAAAWSFDGAPQSLSVSNDGETLVEQYHGANLLDADAGPATVMLVFNRRGRVVRVVTLRDLITNVAGLPRSVSHRVWADAFGFDTDGSYVVDTVEGRHFRFALPGWRSTDVQRARRP